MAIYEYKDYLTFFDIADYLKCNKIHDFDLSNKLEFGELGIFLQDFIIQGRLNPYFYAGFYADCKIFKSSKKGFVVHSEAEMVNVNGFFRISPQIYNNLVLSEALNIKDFVPYTKKNKSNLAYHLNNTTYRIHLLDMRFDKTEISSIFSLPELSSPKNQELSTRTANTASKIIGALAIEMLGMDLSKPYSDNTNGKIKEALNKMGLEVSTDTIAHWLKLAFDNTK